MEPPGLLSRIQASLSDASGHPFAPDDSAVLLPLVGGDGLSLLLTRRSSSVARHAGELSFPGGRIEPADADPLAAALRESREEIGIRDAQILGFVARVEARWGGHVHAFAALVDPSRLDPGAWPNPEVETPLLVSVAELAGSPREPVVSVGQVPGIPSARVLSHETRRVALGGKGERVVNYWRLSTGDTLWGVTGHILAVFLARVFGWVQPAPSRIVGLEGVRP